MEAVDASADIHRMLSKFWKACVEFHDFFDVNALSICGLPVKALFLAAHSCGLPCVGRRWEKEPTGCKLIQQKETGVKTDFQPDQFLDLAHATAVWG